MSDLTYDYRPRLPTMAAAFAFFAVCALIGEHEARSNQRGLVIDGFIKLDISQATIFLWGMCAVCVFMATIGLLGIIHAFTSKKKLILGETAIRLHKSGFSDTIVSIDYTDIKSLVRRQVRSQRFLTIYYTKGKIGIASVFLPNVATFEEICRILAQRVSQASQTR